MKYVITASGFVVAASELGVVDFEPEDVIEKGRLQPGRMLLVDLARGRVVGDEEIKREIAAQKPYVRVARGQQDRPSSRCPTGAPAPALGVTERRQLLRAFGYTREDLRVLLTPMATNGEEPTGSMGTDAPLAVLSDRPVTLFRYFKQQFAQVTNPPIDPIREKLVMTLVSCLGGEGNLLAETPRPVSAARARAADPDQRGAGEAPRRAPRGLPARACCRRCSTPRAEDPGAALEKALAALCAAAERAVDERREPARRERSRGRRRARAHPEPARDERRAPRAGARRQAHARRVSSSRRARRARWPTWRSSSATARAR